MRRSLVGLTAFLTLAGTFVALPVYAAPLPEAHPVAASVEEVALGSVAAPEGDAVVTADGEPVSGGVDGSGTVTSPSAEPSASASAATQSPAAHESQKPNDDVASSGDELPEVPALTLSQPDTAKFSSVGVTWRQGDVTDIVVQLRVSDEHGDWGRWTALEPDDIVQTGSTAAPGENVRGGTAPYWTGESYGVEVIVQGAGGVVPEDVRVALIDPGTSAADATPAAAAATDQAHAASAMPPVYSRAQWGADESIRTWDPEYAPTIKAATLHHTADRNDYTAAEVFGIMRATYTYHTVTRGWGDIGYNVIVDRFGRMFEGRYGGLASTVIGAHAGGFNTGTFGVSMLGNYDEVPVPQATVNAVAEIIAWKFDLYGVDPYGSTSLVSGGGGTAKYSAGTRVTLPTIFGHRDVGSTVCPGQYGYARLGEIRDQVALLSTANPSGITTTVNDASTGFIPDLSPVQLASVVAPNGATTVFVRGADNSIWYRTGTGVSWNWTDWRSIPLTNATSGPAAVTWNGSQVDVVVRGGDGAYWRSIGWFDAAGRPGTFGAWVSMGGVFSSAPSVAAVSYGRMAVVGRGGNGSAYQRLWNGSSWSDWTSLGGQANSAATISADPATSQYLVSVMGSDGLLWQTGTSTTKAGAFGWVGTGVRSTHGAGTSASSWQTATGRLLSLGGAGHSAVMLRPDGTRQSLGGQMNSVVTVAKQSDGSYLVLGRGSDNEIWMTRYVNGRGGDWISLGGSAR